MRIVWLSPTMTSIGYCGSGSPRAGPTHSPSAPGSEPTSGTSPKSKVSIRSSWLDVEFQSLVSEIDRVAAQTTFNGVNLFDGTAGTIDIQVGSESGETITLTLEDVTAGGLALSGGTFDLTTVSNASAALDVIDTAVDSVSSFRGALGASQNRLQSTFRSIQSQSENLSAAESRIRDVDVAAETADLTRNSILQQAALSVLGQANVQPQLALSLLG